MPIDNLRDLPRRSALLGVVVKPLTLHALRTYFGRDPFADSEIHVDDDANITWWLEPYQEHEPYDFIRAWAVRDMVVHYLTGEPTEIGRSIVAELDSTGLDSEPVDIYDRMLQDIGVGIPDFVELMRRKAIDTDIWPARPELAAA